MQAQAKDQVTVTQGEAELGSAPGRSIRWCDCIVVLASAGFDAEGEGTFPALVRGLAGPLPIYAFVPDLEVDEVRVSKTSTDGLSIVHVWAEADRRRDARINQLLCDARLLRPLLLTDAIGWSRYLATRYATLTVFCFTDATVAALKALERDREVEPALRRALARCDLLLAPPDIARHLARRYGWEARVLEGDLLSNPAAVAATRPPPPPDAVYDPRARAIAARFRPQTDEPARDWSVPAASWSGGTVVTAHRLLEEAMPMIEAPLPASGGRLNVLICYDDAETHIGTVREYLESYAMFSQHHVSYASGVTSATTPLDLSVFDVVVLHYSVRVALTSHLSPHLSRALRAFGGLKILYMQDDYENTETSRRWIEYLGLHTVFTCVLRDYHEAVFPLARFPSVEFIRTLTGYVPLRFDRERALVPMAERKIMLGYRGRKLAFWFGDLAREKFVIGERMREICKARGLEVDIEWDEDKRIYGDAWYDFHERVRAVLGSESGSNVYDDDGSIRAAVQAALAEHPDMSYEEVHAKFLEPHDGRIVAAQISPRVFEAVSLGAALVLFRGRYDNIVQPGVHYIPLEKDFSNVDEVLALLADDEYLTRLTRRAYEDIILSGKYSYRRMVADFDAWLTSRLRHASGQRPVTSLVGFLDPYSGGITAPHAGFSRGGATNELLCYWSDTFEKAPTADRSAYGPLPAGGAGLPDPTAAPVGEDRPLLDVGAVRLAQATTWDASAFGWAVDAVVVFGGLDTAWYASLVCSLMGDLPLLRVSAAATLSVQRSSFGMDIGAPPASDDMVSELLSDLGIHRPLFVLHDRRFEPFVTSRYSPLRVLLLTERLHAASSGTMALDLVVCPDSDTACLATRALTLPLRPPTATRLPAEPTFLVPGALDGTVDLPRLARLPETARLLLCDWPAEGAEPLDARMMAVGPVPPDQIRWYAGRVHAALFSFTEGAPPDAPLQAATLDAQGVPCVWYGEAAPPRGLERCQWAREPAEVMQLAMTDERRQTGAVDAAASRALGLAVARALAAAKGGPERLRVLVLHDGSSVMAGSRHEVRAATLEEAERVLAAEGPFDAVVLRAESPPFSLIRRLRRLGAFTVLWLDDAERPSTMVERLPHLPVHAVATHRDPQGYGVDASLARMEWLAPAQSSTEGVDDWLTARARRPALRAAPP